MLIHSIKCLGSAQEQGQCLVEDITVDLFGHLDTSPTVHLRRHLHIEFVEVRELWSGPEGTIRTKKLPVDSSRRSLRTQVEPAEYEHIPGRDEFLFHQQTRTS